MNAHPPGSPSGELFSLNADQWTGPYWAAAREHRLVCAQCAVCGQFRMPPSPFCPGCRSQELFWTELPGTGSVYSFTVVRHSPVPELSSSVPYVIAVVALDGAPGARLITNIVSCDPDTVEIDQRVKVVWDDLNAGLVVPRFSPLDPVHNEERTP